MAVKEVGSLISELLAICMPVNGKKKVKKTQRVKEQLKLSQAIDSMLNHLAKYLDDLKDHDKGVIGFALEKALQKSFSEFFGQKHKKKHIRAPISTRGEKSYIFVCADKAEYLLLVKDSQRFRTEVVDKLGEYEHATGHKASCKGPKRYKLVGFRQDDRTPIVTGGQQERFPIRMVKCECCGQKFSLLPSFLPREKHFIIDIIGQVFRSVLLFSQSIYSILVSLQEIGGIKVKSKQTIFNWLQWMGTHHPATVLTRADVVGSGYLQEDEGFEKEPQLHTYSVFMVDPQNLLIWHADYVDHVDEESLCASFGKFAQRLKFKILGVTKDKWQASTKALKRIFHQIWIGFCHRHCLKKFWQALLEYQQQSNCSLKKLGDLYKKFKKVLETSTSKLSVKINLRLLNDEAFNNPLLRERLLELEKNGVYYASHQKRKGITKTTSIVDNVLKIVKRKLKMVESFRDQKSTQFLFQAMANTRNFVPFLPGAKNAHKSPFMLAQGKTYNLPWIQAMNFHNAFLFTENAF
jgi:hypothetical protein